MGLVPPHEGEEVVGEKGEGVEKWITYASSFTDTAAVYQVVLSEPEIMFVTEGSKLPTYAAQITTESLGDIDKPLTIGRETLIGVLQENLDKEREAREKAEKNVADSRAKAIEALNALTDDELYNLVQQNTGWGSEAMAERLTKAKEDETYVTPKLATSRRENDLEKFVRVLGMASDSTVEVKPNQPIYNLL